jgi:hypothetical protein
VIGFNGKKSTYETFGLAGTMPVRSAAKHGPSSLSLLGLGRGAKAAAGCSHALPGCLFAFLPEEGNTLGSDRLN